MLSIIFAAILWSFDGLLRQSLYSLPPALVVFWEHALGFFLLLFIVPKWLPDIKKMGKKEWIAAGVVALFSGALGTILYTAALGKVNYIQFSVVVLLQQLQPIWAILAAALLLKEPVSKRFLMWALLALVSAYLITFKDLTVNWNTGGETAIAGLLAISAGFLWGSSTAVSKIVLSKVSFFTATAIRFFLAPVFAILLLASQQKISGLFTVSNTQRISLGVITVSTGLVALLFYYYGLKRTPARIATICELVWPSSAIFIDYFMNGVMLSMTQILGVTLLSLSILKIRKIV